MSEAPDLPLRVATTREAMPPASGRRWRWLLLLPLVPLLVPAVSSASSDVVLLSLFQYGVNL